MWQCTTRLTTGSQHSIYSVQTVQPRFDILATSSAVSRITQHQISKYVLNVLRKETFFKKMGLKTIENLETRKTRSLHFSELRAEGLEAATGPGTALASASASARIHPRLASMVVQIQ